MLRLLKKLLWLLPLFCGLARADIAEEIDNERNASGNTVAATLTFAAGAYGFVWCGFDGNGPGNTSLTFSENVAEAVTFNEIATLDVYDATDVYGQEAAWFQFTAGGSITVTCNQGANGPWAGIWLVELSNVTGFDTSAYARANGTSNLSNTNAAATRFALGLAWGGGTLAANTGAGWTDDGAGAEYAGTPAVRMHSRIESSVQSRNGQFSAGTGVAPFHVSQVIFTNTGGGAGSIAPRIMHHRRQMGT